MNISEDYLLVQKSFDVLVRLVPAIGAVVLLFSSLVSKKRVVFLFIYYLTLIATAWSVFFPFVDNEFLSDPATYRVIYILFVAVMCVIPIFREKNSMPAEYYFILLGLLFGSGLLLTAKHLVVVYVSLEITSFSAYFLTSFRFKGKSDEASLKYVLFGGMSSAIMLFGIALSYYFSFSFISADFSPSGGLLIAQILILVGYFFKTTLIPFHFWSPNVYQVAPVSTVTVLSILPKISGIVALMSYYQSLNADLQANLQPFLIFVLICTIILGTTGAIQQSNTRRMIAYGAIAQSGLLAVFALFGETYSLSFIYYSIVYTIANLLLFYVLAIYEGLSITRLSSLSGLGRRFPFLAILLTTALLSLIGLPPLAGFTAKFYLFSSVYSFIKVDHTTLWIVFLLVGLLSTAVSLYFYIKPVYFLFFKKRKGLKIKIGILEYALATFLALLLFCLFIYPDSIRTFVDYLSLV